MNSPPYLVRTMVTLIAWMLASLSVAGQERADLELLPPVSATEPSEVTSDEIIGDTSAVDTTWLSPIGWFSSPLWQFGLELGLNGSEGNAQSFSVVASSSAKRETEQSTLAMNVTYGKTDSNGIETQNYGILDARWDWKMTPQWFLFTKTMLEYDEFKAFDLRLVKTGGLGYHLIKNDHTTLTGRFGAGASREFEGPADEWVPEANFGGDLEHCLSQRQKLKLTMDYYPAWETFSDYRLVTNAYWEILLDEATNLSLKIGAIDRYDSTPFGLDPNDVDYFATLLWKL